MESIGNSLDDKILELCRRGEKLKAVKLHKDSTGIGLKESKDYVEKLAAANGIVFKGACFVATACYGNYNAPEVIVLRKFRDDILLKSFFGRMFVKFYYSISPFFATLISNSDTLRNTVRQYLLEPIIRKLQQ